MLPGMNLSIKTSSSTAFKYSLNPAKPLRRYGETSGGFIGQRVVVAGTGAFGRHTGHHHAALMLPIASVSAAFDPTKSHGTSMTTVQGFYLALSAGNGEEAVKFVVPEKRTSGPLSAIAIRNFYSNLVEPLTLIDVAPTRSDEYRVRYTYVAPSRGRCDGEALVRTTKVNGLNLIDSIKAISGC